MNFVPQTYPDWERFVRCGPVEGERIQLLVVRHPERLDDALIDGLWLWDGADRARMSAFRHDGAKTSWAVSRFLIRSAVAPLEGVSPHELRFRLGANGKPRLEGGTLRVNWSHSPGWVALAISRRVEIGCDIEDVGRPAEGLAEIARDYFRAEESSWVLGARDEDERRLRFFTLYTQKEAFLKARGTGLQAPLSGAESRILLPPFVEGPIACLCLEDGGRCVASVCREDGVTPDLAVRYHRLSPPCRSRSG